MARPVNLPAMKQTEPPICPRCNRNSDVHKLADEVAGLHGPQPLVQEGYVLDGIVIRPGSFDWYCESCSQSFAGARIYWGKFLTNRAQ